MDIMNILVCVLIAIMLVSFSIILMPIIRKEIVGSREQRITMTCIVVLELVIIALTAAVML